MIQSLPDDSGHGQELPLAERFAPDTFGPILIQKTLKGAFTAFLAVFPSLTASIARASQKQASRKSRRGTFIEEIKRRV